MVEQQHMHMPPVLPDLAEELIDKFLGHPENLSIHSLDRNQRFYPRTINPESLFHTDVTLLQTTIKVDRNPTTGELLGYKEEYLSNTSNTAENSTSLRRKPGPLGASIKGSSTSYPFWPGGLDEPALDDLTNVDSETEALNFDELLTVPPGFARGIKYDRKITEETEPESNIPHNKPTILTLADILTEDDAILFSEEEEEVEKTSSDYENATVSVTKSESLENLVSQTTTEVSEEKTVIKEKPKEIWAIAIDVNKNVDNLYQKMVPDPAYNWPFELDTFQKQGVLHLENHDSVFIAAHTSAGKTVVAEYAIALSMKHKTRTIYTSPIKALSNQKFRDFKQTFGDVGLITGDVQLHPEGACLIMTTEILRSMLYNGADVIRDLEWVIFDEVHYINDQERGVVWEEVLIMLPQHVSIILLSATVPNTVEFADWVGRTKKKKIYVISTLKRPVPLEHYLYTGNSNKTNNELFLLVDANKNFVTQGYSKAFDALKERASKSSQSFGAKGSRQGNPMMDKNVWLSVIEMLKKKDKLPAIAFTFSKRKIESNTENLQSVDLTTAAEKGRIHLFFQESISRLKKPDRELPQVVQMQELLKRGIGMHHSGILPILKEVVEMLFEKKLVKLLFATETFAMGVNVPSRTVIFDSIRKHDGTNFRELLPGEYIQMAGRAGRRGLDPTGTVIILCKGGVPETADLHKMMLGKPTQLQSQFRLTYSMILNLLRVDQLRVEDMMKRSFSEFSHQKDSTKYKEELDKTHKQVSELKDVECFWCEDIESYYKTCQYYWRLKSDLQNVVLSHPQAIKSLTAGRIIVVRRQNQQSTLGVILSSTTNYKSARIFTTLMICEQQSNSEDETKKILTAVSESGASDWLKVKSHHSNLLFQPNGPCGHEVLPLQGDDILIITTKTLKIDSEKIAEDYKRRQIPRFRSNPPGQSTVTATQELIRILETTIGDLPGLDPVQDLHIRDIDLVEQFRELKLTEESFDKFNCTRCPSFEKHFDQMSHNMGIKDRYQHLKYLLSDESLELLPEYKQRIEVLKQLNYIDATNTVQLKGRVACEMSNHELILTELVFENVLTNLHEADIAAILSCLVFEMKNCSEPNLNADLVKGKNKVIDIATKIGILQKQCGLLEPVEDYVGQFKFGLMEVVFEWARGTPFAKITELTDVQEGIIVRCIQRLNEILKDVRNAARIIGDPVLLQKMKDTSSMIKRDIVFAASLYTQ